MARTTKRIAKKWAGRAVAAGLTLPFVLDHAKESFWALRDVGQQRALIRQRMRVLGTLSPDEMRYATRQFRAHPVPALSVRAPSSVEEK